jgi:hypothetical protein
MKSSIFWDITPCSPLKDNRYEEHVASKFRFEDVLGLFFDSEDGSDMYPLNTDRLSTAYVVLRPRKQILKESYSSV